MRLLCSPSSRPRRQQEDDIWEDGVWRACVADSNSAECGVTRKTVKYLSWKNSRMTHALFALSYRISSSSIFSCLLIFTSKQLYNCIIAKLIQEDEATLNQVVCPRIEYSMKCNFVPRYSTARGRVGALRLCTNFIIINHKYITVLRVQEVSLCTS